MEKLRKFWKNPSVNCVGSSVLSILVGFFLCLIIMIVNSAVSDALPLDQAWKGFRILLGTLFYSGGSFGGLNMKLVGDMLLRATPLIMTGLSVALAYKTGLFNIGAAGQYVMGIVAALVVGILLGRAGCPSFLAWLLAFLAAALAGFLWGCIPGLFKALLNVNEVITCIMTNWIALHIAHWIFEVDYKKGAESCIFVNLTESTKSNFIYKTSKFGVSTSKLGLDKLFKGSNVDGGIIIAIVIAILVWVVLNKTTFGFELQATGKNRHAAKYAGIDDKKNIVLSMAISGALAAMGAALWFLNAGNEYNWTVNTALPSAGFNGIPVAFLAFCNPIGTAVAACFLSYINIAGEQIKGAVAINNHISDLIVAIIVYLSAFSLIFRDVLLGKGPIANLIRTKKEQKVQNGEEIENIEESQAEVETPIEENVTEENTVQDETAKEEE